MNLGLPADTSDPADQAAARRAVQAADAQNLKRGADVELSPARGGSPRARLILTDTVTGVRYEVKIASGALVLAALPYV